MSKVVPTIIHEQRNQKKDQTALTLRLSQELKGKVSSLPCRTGAKSEQDGIRDAIRFYDYVLSCVESGSEIKLVDSATGKEVDLFTNT